MSATMDADQFSAYFDGAAGIVIQGRQHPLTVRHFAQKTQSNFCLIFQYLLFLVILI